MARHAPKISKPVSITAQRAGRTNPLRRSTPEASPHYQDATVQAASPHYVAPLQPQMKIKIGAANDPAEAEADRVAQSVVQHSGPVTTPSPGGSAAPIAPLQRVNIQRAEEEIQETAAPEEVQAKEEQADLAPAEELQSKEEEVQGKEEEVQSKEEEIQGKEEEAQAKEEEVAAKEEEVQEKEEEVAAKEEIQETAAPEMPAAEEVQATGEEEAQLEEEEVQSMEEESVQEMADPLGEVQPQVIARTEEEDEAQLEAEEIQPEPAPEPEPEVQMAAEVLREDEEEAQLLRRNSPATNRGGGETSPQTEREIRGRDGAGEPLADGVRGRMETGIGADFSDVRIHTDPAAAALSRQLGARAFAFGRNVFFGQGEYKPGTPSGDFLIAHELTHTVQQGAAPQFLAKSEDEALQASFRDVIDGLLEAIDWLEIDLSRITDNIPGYTLFSYIVEYDFIRGRSVDPSTANLIRGLMGIIPYGNLAYEKLNEHGLIDRAGDFVDNEMSRLNLSRNRLENTLSSAWDEMGITLGISGNLRVLDRHFTPLYNDVISFAESVSDTLLELIKEAVVRPLVGFLEEHSPAYQLATKVIGKKFPLEDEVEAPTVDILRDFLLLIGKETEVAEMEEKGTLQETADWIDTQLGQFFSLLGRFEAIVTRIWDAFTLSTLSDLPGVFNDVWTDFTDLLQDFFDFALEVAAKVLELIKISLLEWLSGFANEVPGFHLMTVIIGRNPFTQEEVPATTQNIIRGFMGLVPGGEAKYQELEQTGVVSEAAAKIDALIEELGISLEMIVGIFTGIWEGLSIDDLLSPIEAFQRIVDEFGEPIARLFTFVRKVVLIVVELILRMMNFPLDLIGQIIENTIAAFDKIKEDPVQFLLNLIDAIKLGFTQFFDNIVDHLIGGLQTWLFGTLGEAGIQVPQDLSIQSVLGMAMDVLGITVDNVMERLALKIGQERVDQIRGVVDTLTGIWTFVKDVMERGAIAIWEYAMEKLNDLWDMIMGAVQNWIMTRIITAVTTKILSMLDPTGIMAVINSAIAFYNAVMSFIEQLRALLEIVNTFVRGVLDIANGNIQTAADFLEQALSDGIPVAIAFLARQVGLGGLSTKIQEMIESAREKINEAIDWLIDKALAAGTAFLNMARGAVAAVVDWWTDEETFQAEDGQRHRLYFEGTGDNARLTVASNPTAFTDFLAAVGEPTDPAKIAAKRQAETLAGQIDTEKRRPLVGNTEAARDADAQAKANEVSRLLGLLVAQTTILFGATVPDWGAPDPSRMPDLGGQDASHGNFGTTMNMKPLTIQNKATGSAPDRGAHDTYDKLDQRRTSSGATYYIRGHLLNEWMGGRGVWDNMVPLSRSGNAQHAGQEDTIKAGMQSRAIIEYNVVANYTSRGDKDSLIRDIRRGGGTLSEKDKKIEIVEAEDHVPESLTLEAYRLEDAGGGNYTRTDTIVSTNVTNAIDRNAANYFIPGSRPIGLSDFNTETSKSKMLRSLSPFNDPSAGGVTLPILRSFIMSREDRGVRYRTYDDLAWGLKNKITPDTLRTLRDMGYIKMGRG